MRLYLVLAFAGVVACTGGSCGSTNSTGRAGAGGSSSMGAAGAGGSSTTGSGGTGFVPSGSLFDQPHPWTTDVSGYPKAPMSDAIIAGLMSAGGWGQGNVFLTEPSLLVLSADASTPTRPFTPSDDFYSPDCDNVPFPIPSGGAIEGESGYACAGDGDCHLLVVSRATKRLFEMWRANITGSSQSQFQGGCAAAWDLSKQYGPTLRGKGCTSADAAGLPITALLATADEAAAGTVPHALRFILPNARIRHGVYVPPATHSTQATSGGATTPPYGVRFRLKASYDIASLSAPGARAMAQALKTYGMFLADGGNIALTIASDRFTAAKWADSGVTSNRSLAALQVADFEVVDYGAETDWLANTDCNRNP